MSEEASLRAERAAIGYGATLVAPGLDLAVPQGRFTALLGPNGCGKSTILRSLAGLQPLRSGAILLDGAAIATLPAKAVARRVGILGQEAASLDGLTVLDLIRQGRYPHRSMFGRWSEADAAAVEEALRLTDTGGLRNRPLDTLSGGQRQRAWIAMTLAQQSRILLLDEPTTYLDLAHQIETLGLMRSLVRDRGATVVAVLHDINQAARYADHVVLLRAGEVVEAGAPRAVLTPAALRAVFGVETIVIDDPESGAPLCIPRMAQPAPG